MCPHDKEHYIALGLKADLCVCVCVYVREIGWARKIEADRKPKRWRQRWVWRAFKVSFIRNRVFITDEGVSSLYFTLKSQEVWKVTSQQQIFALINIPWAITCEKGIGAQQGTPAERKGETWRKSNPSSSADQSVGVENLEWILSEGQWRNIVNLEPWDKDDGTEMERESSGTEEREGL